MQFILKVLFFALVVPTLSGCGYWVSTKGDPLPKQERAPAFELTNQEDESVRLYTEGNGTEEPTVIEFYRGEFCYLAEGRLEDLQEDRNRIAESGARLVAIGSDDPKTVERMSEDLGLTYDVLSDPDASVIEAYGVTMDGKQDGRHIAVPATFVVAQDGTIVFAHVGETAGDFADIDDVVAAVRKARSTNVASAK